MNAAIAGLTSGPDRFGTLADGFVAGAWPLPAATKTAVTANSAKISAVSLMPCLLVLRHRHRLRGGLRRRRRRRAACLQPNLPSTAQRAVKVHQAQRDLSLRDDQFVLLRRQRALEEEDRREVDDALFVLVVRDLH